MTPPARVVLLVTSPRVPAGLLSAQAWATTRSGPVLTTEPSAPGVTALAAAGVTVTALDALSAPEVVAAQVTADAIRAGHATWWAGEEVGADLMRAFTDAATNAPAETPVVIELLTGSWDPPGAWLLDVVKTMHRLRSPGGCPWDAAQDHVSLAPYLLEEAYEAFQAIEDRDWDALREELGDVLLQIAFHARLAEELPEGRRWSIDDVARGLVEKLVRRHPHVFGDVDVADADEVNRNWETIKAAERGDVSALANVPVSAPALTLAATLQRKAARLDRAEPPAAPLDVATAAFLRRPDVAVAGELLWGAVAAMRAAGIDPEAALRDRARAFRDSHTSR